MSKERLVELIGNAPIGVNGITLLDKHEPKAIEEIADYLLANGVIVPPCKVGDVVWINTQYGTIRAIVSQIKLIENNGVLVRLAYDLSYCYNEHINTYGAVGYTEDKFEFGKTVFLTREDAEKKLEESKNERG